MAETDIVLSVGLDAGDVSTRAKKLQKDIQETFNKVDTDKVDEKTKRTLTRMSELYDKSDELQNKLKQMEDVFPSEVADRIKEIKNNIQGFTEELSKAKTQEDKDLFKNAIANSKQLLQQQQEYAKLLENHTAAEVLHATDAEYQKLEQSLNDCSNKTAILVAETNKLSTNYRELLKNTNVFKILGNGLTALGEKIQRCSRDILRNAADFAEMGDAGAAAFSGISSVVVGLSGRIVKSIGQISTAIGEALSTALPIIYSILAALQKVLNVLTKIAKTVAGVIKKGIVTAFNLIKNAITGASKSADSFGLTAKKLFTTLVGFASLRVVFNKLRSAIVAGIKELVLFEGGNNDVNAAITTLQASLTQLRNAWASAFAPILTAVAPLLNHLISLCTQVANAIGMLFARLGGASTFLRAKKVQNDYAKSLDKTGKAAGAAADKLAKFDDLDVLGNDKSGGGGGAVGADALTDMFEEVPIDAKVDDWIDKLKEMWDKADFTELGNLIGTKLRDALNKASDWLVDVGQELAAKLGKSLATLLNGFFSTEGLSEAVGRFFGELYNTWQDFQTAFLENFNFAELGRFISQALMTMVETIDWVQVGYNLALKVNGLFDIMKGAAEKWDPMVIANAIKNFMNSAIDNINWTENAKSFSAFAIKLFQTLRLSLKNIPWSKLGTDLATFLNNIDWKGLATEVAGSVWELLNGLLDFAIAFFDTLEWAKISSAIVEGISAYDWSAISDKFWELLGKALEKSWEVIKSIAKTMWENKKQDILNDGQSVGGWIIEGLVKGIKTMWNLVHPIEWLKSKILGKWMELFQIGSPSKVMEEQGVYLIEGLINGISSMTGSITQIWNNLKVDAIAIWTDIRIQLQNIVTTLTIAINTLWTQTTDTVTQLVTTLKQTLISLWTNIKETLSSLMTTLKDKLIDLWNILKNKVTELVTTLKDTLINIWNIIKTRLTEIVTTLKNTVTELWTKLKEKVLELTTTIKQKVIEGFTDLKDTAISIFTNLKDTVISIWNNLWDGIRTVINWILGGVEKMANGVVSGINRLTSALSAVSFDMPDFLGGGSFHLNIPQLSGIQLPRLAQGAVIPPNRQFLAMLGDQRNGTNIEAPLDTIKQAFADVVANMEVQNTGYSEMRLDGQTFARLVTPYIISELKREGYNVSVLNA